MKDNNKLRSLFKLRHRLNAVLSDPLRLFANSYGSLQKTPCGSSQSASIRFGEGLEQVP